MLTNDEKRMLRVVAAYNDITEEQAEKAIVEVFLNWLLKDDSNPLSNMALKVETIKAQAEKLLTDTAVGYVIETPEQPKVRKKPGRKPRNFVEDTVREVRQAEKMSKDEFVEYFGGKG